MLGHPSALEAKDRIGYLPEERGLYKKMKVLPFLRYMAHLKGVEEERLDHRIDEWLGRVGLPDVGRQRCDELSKGMSQKVQLVAAVLHQLDLLILDEPFSGLDPVSTRLLRDLILEEHARGATILFSTHVMPQAEEICEHIMMVHRGRKVLDASLAEIRSRYDPRTIQLEPLAADASAEALLALPEVEGVERGEAGLDVTLRKGVDPAGAMPRLLTLVPAARIELSRPRLEDVFIEIVADPAADEDEAQLRAELRDPASTVES